MTRTYPNLLNCNIQVVDPTSASSSIPPPPPPLPRECFNVLNKPNIQPYDFVLGTIMR